MIEETRLPENVMADLLRIVPGPEPALEVRLPRIPVVEEALTRRIIPVSDPRLDGNELRYLTQCVQSNWISSAGRFVREFEDTFARMMGARTGSHARNGTTSLHLALAATFGLQPGDEVSFRLHHDRDRQRRPLHGRHPGWSTPSGLVES